MARLPTLVSFVVFVTAGVVVVACHSIANLDVTYVKCVPKGPDYVERFGDEETDDSVESLRDRCWNEEIPANAKVFTQDGDLIVRPAGGQRWDPATGQQGPFFFRTAVNGDFLIVTQAEPASTQLSDHCLNKDEAAGIAARMTTTTTDAGANAPWVTLFVHPYFDPDAGITYEEACKDDSTKPPTARVAASSFGYAKEADGGVPPQDDEVVGVGEDSEAYIALCRQEDQLAFYYRDTKANPPRWRLIDRRVIPNPRAPLDVGVTASATALPTLPTSTSSNMEGHFTWVVFRQLDQPVADGCDGALEALVIPETK